MAAALHVIRYLKGTKDLRLALGANETHGNILVGYTDSDWGSDKTDSKSISGFVFFLGHGAIAWASRKQHSVSLSSTEGTVQHPNRKSRPLGNLCHAMTIFTAARLNIGVLGSSPVKSILSTEREPTEGFPGACVQTRLWCRKQELRLRRLPPSSVQPRITNVRLGHGLYHFHRERALAFD